MEALLPAVLLGTLGAKVLDLVRFVRGHDWNRTALVVASWVVGIALTFAAGEASIFDGWMVPGLNVGLEELDAWSKVFVGTGLLSALGVVYDTLAALDNTRSTQKPNL